MKNVFLILAALLFSNSSFAGEGFSTEALQVLLQKNPTAVSPEGSQLSVTKLISENMLSSFDNKGFGDLTVITNECQINQKTGHLDCQLTLLNSDRKITPSGAYAPGNGMTESSLTINFTVTLGMDSIVGPVTFSIAG